MWRLVRKIHLCLQINGGLHFYVFKRYHFGQYLISNQMKIVVFWSLYIVSFSWLFYSFGFVYLVIWGVFSLTLQRTKRINICSLICRVCYRWRHLFCLLRDPTTPDSLLTASSKSGHLVSTQTEWSRVPLSKRISVRVTGHLSVSTRSKVHRFVFVFLVWPFVNLK